ncbi:uncharacterized mitochondrial protein AtMg00810-like [Capsicum annuum]|uniref:uncharacterized mitochondrial protein AtMg00810-like n=1 Tax=Capsicum annuum TaxID=4072 RepID=UPI001FB1248B|nr:uncharacterized mitochondrial protein AtMg00810-like [Capsicum annuum]
MSSCNSISTTVGLKVRLTVDPKGKKVNSTLFERSFGNLLYLTASRPDIAYVMSLVSRCIGCSTEYHLIVAKRVLRYVKGATDFDIFYKKVGKSDHIDFSDSDYAGVLREEELSS